MLTLKSVMQQRGYGYISVFGHAAEDIYFNTIEDLCFSLGYILRNIRRFDAEIPEDRYVLLKRVLPNYSITSGFTSGGNEMKRAPQYRIYFRSISNMPSSLRCRLQDDNQMRITGSLFVEACMYLGFNPGNKQDNQIIETVILKVFNNDNEKASFIEGLKGNKEML